MAEFHTDPGDRSVSELEREVDHERERVSATIDELQSRASMGNIVDQLVKAVSENGGEVSRNLGRSLRDNPIAALLTGVGLAWLMAGSSGTSSKQSDWDWEDPRYVAALIRIGAPSACRAIGLAAHGQAPLALTTILHRRATASGSARLMSPARSARRCPIPWRACEIAPPTSRTRRGLGSAMRATSSARLVLLPVITPGPYAEALPGLAVTCGRDWTA